jgi:hypothetical protein
MPMVKNNLEQLVEGEYPIVLYRPSEAVSFGAARFAYGIPDSVPEQEPVPKPSLDPGVNQDAKKPDTNPVIHNQVIEQLTDCCYGIWLPTEGKLEGEVKFILPCGKSRPATSEKVTIYSESSRVVIKIYRSKEKNKLIKTASMEDCDSMLWIPFDVKASSTYEVSITVLEDYGLEVELFSDDGNVYKKSTSDLLSKLV